MQDDKFKFPVAESNLRQPGRKIVEYVRRTRRPPEKEEDEDLLEEPKSKTEGSLRKISKNVMRITGLLP